MKVLAPPSELTAMARLMLDEHEIMTIAMAYRISPSIYDTIILAATDAAATLFGFDSGTMMIGQAVSSLHHLNDIANTRKRATLRSLGAMPDDDDYPIRIIRQDGEEQGVSKHVDMCKDNYSGLTLWISRHEKRRTRRPTPAPQGTVPAEKLRELYGQYTLTEAELYLHGASAKSINALTVSFHRSSIIHDKSVSIPVEIESTHDISVNSVPDAALVALNGRVIRSRSGTEKRICVCLKCGYFWMTRTQNRPRECPDCHSWTWDDPVVYGPGGVILGNVEEQQPQKNEDENRK